MVWFESRQIVPSYLFHRWKLTRTLHFRKTNLRKRYCLASSMLKCILQALYLCNSREFLLSLHMLLSFARIILQVFWLYSLWMLWVILYLFYFAGILWNLSWWNRGRVQIDRSSWWSYRFLASSAVFRRVDNYTRLLILPLSPDSTWIVPWIKQSFMDIIIF